MSAPQRAPNATAPPTAELAAEPVPTTPVDETADARKWVRVVIPGSDRTYEARAVLRGLGLRWDPATHAWHGRLSAAERRDLETRLGIAARPVVPLEAFPAEPSSDARNTPQRPPAPRPTLPRTPARSPRPHDGSRNRLEARVALPDEEPDYEDGRGVEGSRFTIWDVTSGLPDDSREADERRAERALRDLRARVKAARAEDSRRPDLRIVLERDWLKALVFYTRFGIAEHEFRSGVASERGRLEDAVT